MKTPNLSQFLINRYNLPDDSAFEKGRMIYAQNCARCHSSQDSVKTDRVTSVDDFTGVDFLKTETAANGEIYRTDFLGNDKSTDANGYLGIYSCRALHSNHMKNHVWEEFASVTYKEKPTTITGRRGQVAEGGRGYMRNVPLLNVWAHAPFLHNNALGPELCGDPAKIPQGLNMWRTSVDGKQIGSNKTLCEASFDPSMEGRLKLFDASVDELLTVPSERRKKIPQIDTDVVIPLGIRLKKGDSQSGTLQSIPLQLVIPMGFPVNKIGSFNIKDFVIDMSGAVPLYEKYSEAFEKNKTEEGKKALEDFNNY